jgi:hypothetical protein
MTVVFSAIQRLWLLLSAIVLYLLSVGVGLAVPS